MGISAEKRALLDAAKEAQASMVAASANPALSAAEVREARKRWEIAVKAAKVGGINGGVTVEAKAPGPAYLPGVTGVVRGRVGGMTAASLDRRDAARKAPAPPKPKASPPPPFAGRWRHPAMGGGDPVIIKAGR